jgi:uncharacterized membrane protein
MTGTLILLSRAIHIVAGILWAGVMFVLVSTVMPIARQHAKDGAERWSGLVFRRLGPISGIAAVLTVLSGGYLMETLHRGDNTLSGLTLKIGAIAGVLALIVGLALARPLAFKLAALAHSNDPQAQQHRDQLQRRATRSYAATAALVAIAVLCMSLFRYASMLS